MYKFNFIPENFETNTEYKKLFNTRASYKFVVFDNLLKGNLRTAKAWTNNHDGSQKVEIADCIRRFDALNDDGSLQSSQIIVGLPADELVEGYLIIT